MFETFTPVDLVAMLNSVLLIGLSIVSFTRAFQRAKRLRLGDAKRSSP